MLTDTLFGMELLGNDKCWYSYVNQSAEQNNMDPSLAATCSKKRRAPPPPVTTTSPIRPGKEKRKAPPPPNPFGEVDDDEMVDTVDEKGGLEDRVDGKSPRKNPFDEEEDEEELDLEEVSGRWNVPQCRVSILVCPIT